MLNIEAIYNKLAIKIANLKKNELMSKHTSFKVGGPVDIMILPSTVEEVKYALKVCKDEQIQYHIMGNGSNLLVKDKGIRGVMIKIGDNFNRVEIEGERVIAQAGILLSSLSTKVAEKNLTGFEFASGIPGTLGGAVTMNAGAYGGEMKDVLTGCSAIDENGNIIFLDKQDMELDYRSSVIQRRGLVVLEAEMKLETGDPAKIKETLKELTKKRTSKQPLHLPSAGSTFKRPPGHFAGKLIEDAGLKGVRLGGAQVSDLHSGFIVNVDQATAEDIINLIGLVQKVVKDKFGVELNPEVKIVGEV